MHDQAYREFYIITLMSKGFSKTMSIKNKALRLKMVDI